MWPFKKKAATSKGSTIEIIGEVPVKRHFPAIKMSVVGAIAIPLIQWLITKEVTAPAAIGSVMMILGGAVTHSQVTPTKDIVAKMAEVATETAAGINASTAGPPGEVTLEATRVSTDVVSEVAGIGADVASQVISGILAKRAAKKTARRPLLP